MLPREHWEGVSVTSTITLDNYGLRPITISLHLSQMTRGWLKGVSTTYDRMLEWNTKHVNFPNSHHGFHGTGDYRSSAFDPISTDRTVTLRRVVTNKTCSVTLARIRRMADSDEERRSGTRQGHRYQGWLGPRGGTCRRGRKEKSSLRNT